MPGLEKSLHQKRIRGIQIPHCLHFPRLLENSDRTVTKMPVSLKVVSAGSWVCLSFLFLAQLSESIYPHHLFLRTEDETDLDTDSNFDIKVLSSISGSGSVFAVKG